MTVRVFRYRTMSFEDKKVRKGHGDNIHVPQDDTVEYHADGYTVTSSECIVAKDGTVLATVALPIKYTWGCSSNVERHVEAVRDGGSSPSGPTNTHFV